MKINKVPKKVESNKTDDTFLGTLYYKYTSIILSVFERNIYKILLNLYNTAPCADTFVVITVSDGVKSS